MMGEDGCFYFKIDLKSSTFQRKNTFQCPIVMQEKDFGWHYKGHLFVPETNLNEGE